MFGRAFRYLSACVALAAGEACAALVPSGAEAWMALVLAASWVALLGYGFAVRGWPLICVFLAGAALYFRASVDEERGFRERPWLRNAACVRQSAPPSRLRRDLSERIGLGLGQRRETANLNRALLLGERRAIPKAARQVFVDSGTVHVFAISGLHVMVVAKVLMVLAAMACLPLRYQGVAALVPIWGYVGLIGFPPSAIRAALMASFCFLAPVFGRRADGLVAWALAFLVLHVLRPRLIVDTGSQLSHVVMLAILVAGRISRGKLFVTFAAWAAGLPICALVFGRITPGGLVANLVLLPMAVVSVSAGAVGALSGYVWKPFAVHLNNLSALMTEAMVGVSAAVARLPGANVEIADWGPVDCLGWYVALALFLYLVHRVRLRRDLV